MHIQNHKEEVPFGHYLTRFLRADPPEMAARTGADWDGEDFHLRLLGREYLLSHRDGQFRGVQEGRNLPLPQQTFLLRYLLEGNPADPSGEWKTFRELPWGEMYHVPYTGRILKRAAFTFGPRIHAFEAACEALGGKRIPHSGSCYEFTLIGSYRLRITLWAGDEEFPPSAQILYSDNFALGFTAEDRVVAAEILIAAIKAHL